MGVALKDTRATVEAYLAALNAHGADAVAACVAEDFPASGCEPPPLGGRWLHAVRPGHRTVAGGRVSAGRGPRPGA